MRVLKFGGSSVSSPDRIRDVRKIVLQTATRERVVVVVSAFQNVTNQLLECAQLASKGDQSYHALFGRIADRHKEAVDALVGKSKRKGIHAAVDELLNELKDALHGIYLLRFSPARALDLTASFG